MKISHVLLVAGGLWLLADVAEGFLTAQQGTPPAWYTNYIAPYDTVKGVPTWMVLAGAGALLHIAKK